MKPSKNRGKEKIRFYFVLFTVFTYFNIKKEYLI